VTLIFPPDSILTLSPKSNLPGDALTGKIASKKQKYRTNTKTPTKYPKFPKERKKLKKNTQALSQLNVNKGDQSKTLELFSS
jgi:hypothetical protein